MSEILGFDILRGIHLLCFALGLGPALYYDLRTLVRIKRPVLSSDIAELHRIHRVISLALIGLWTSGIALIWWRTNFDLTAFTPKLWCKIGAVTLLTINAVVLSRGVMPALSRRTGKQLIHLPVKVLLPMTLCAGLSLACWMMALALGASRTLRVADWDVLLPVLGGGAALCITGTVFVMFGIRHVVRHVAPAQVCIG